MLHIRFTKYSSKETTVDLKMIPDEELRVELQVLDELHGAVTLTTRQRSVLLEGAVGAAEKFRNEFLYTMQILNDIRERFTSEDLPGIEPDVVRQQQRQLQVRRWEIVVLYSTYLLLHDPQRRSFILRLCIPADLPSLCQRKIFIYFCRIQSN